ncbi:hypothetical protein QR680_000329 [Steinernema hermaphroditum]|uniref:C-type lectin domain-containing protein n=1 Tax=Steinernema hermaphroditum TaxID=289476 RepID=A0AA39GU68_9BILA|nr:hypothetical protein QR680_000329 [Steinernema hermaphroditum]
MSPSSLFVVVLWISLLTVSLGRRRRRANEVHVINESGRNLRLHCQSIKTDLHDLFLDHEADFKWNFYDIDRGNTHFWCDAYGLDSFFEQFDVFGEMAPAELNNTWLLKPDGLYRFKGSNPERFSVWWKNANSSLAPVARRSGQDNDAQIQIGSSNIFL